MRTVVTLEGMDALERIVERGSKDVGKILARAVFSEANTVLNESKKIVPVDLGVLKNSGKVSRPEVTPAGVEVEITYGGAAAPYALYVHEDPDAQHKPGKTYKYLEQPVMARRDVFVRNVKIALIAWLSRGA